MVDGGTGEKRVEGIVGGKTKKKRNERQREKKKRNPDFVCHTKIISQTRLRTRRGERHGTIDKRGRCYQRRGNMKRDRHES